MGARTSRNRSDDYYAQHVAPLIAQICTSVADKNNDETSWQAWSGRRIYSDKNGLPHAHLIDYTVYLRWTPEYKSGDVKHIGMLKITTKWPSDYPYTALRLQNRVYMTEVTIDIKPRILECFISLLRNSAAAYPSLAIPAEKTALGGLVSESLCIALHILLNSHTVTLNQYVKLLAVGSLRKEHLSIDHIPHNTPEQRRYALRDYYVNNPEPNSPEEEIDLIERIAKTELIVRMYKTMGFMDTRESPDPTGVEMKATVATLTNNCRDKYTTTATNV